MLRTVLRSLISSLILTLLVASFIWSSSCKPRYSNARSPFSAVVTAVIIVLLIYINTVCIDRVTTHYSVIIIVWIQPDKPRHECSLPEDPSMKVNTCKVRNTLHCSNRINFRISCIFNVFAKSPFLNYYELQTLCLSLDGREWDGFTFTDRQIESV